MPRPKPKRHHVPRYAITSHRPALTETVPEYLPSHLASALPHAEQDAVRRRLDRELLERLAI